MMWPDTYASATSTLTTMTVYKSASDASLTVVRADDFVRFRRQYPDDDFDYRMREFERALNEPPRHHPLPTMPHFPMRLPAFRQPPPVRAIMRTQDRGA